MTKISMSQAVEQALELLGKDGGVVAAETSSTRNLRWANSALTTNGDAQENTLSISAFVPAGDGVANGIASGQIRDADDIAHLVSMAKASAIAGGAAQDAMPLAQGPTHSNFHDQADIGDTNGLRHIGEQLSSVLKSDKAEHFGYAEETLDTSYVGTSSGTRMRFVQSSARFELCAKSSARDKSAWSGQGGNSLLDVDVNSHATAVWRGIEHQSNRLDLEPGQHKVTLTPSAFADLMIYLLWTASAREAHEGRSVFSNPLGGTRIGESLTARKLTVASDPHAQGLLSADHVIQIGSSSMSSSFDTGLPIGRAEVISQGKLNALASSRHAAHESQLPFTPLADNIIVTDDDAHGDLDAVASRMGNGLLITCLWYIREVDPQSLLLTGLTRDGVYVVRNGEIIGSANNFRFNESPVGMLSRISDAGLSVPCLPREWADYFPRAQVCPVTIEGFNLSTRSDAI